MSDSQVPPRHDARLSDPLAAFADGELTGPDSRDVVERIATDTAAARRVLQQQHLRRSVARAMKSQAPPVPDRLRVEIERISAGAPLRPAAGAAPPATPAQWDLPVLARIGRWVPSAIAALLLITTAILFLNHDVAPDGRDIGNVLIESAQNRRMFYDRHHSCASGAEPLQGREQFGASLELLPARLSRHLGGADTPSLDLSGIGYTFFAAGQCTLPGAGSVHLIYRHATRSDDSLSLWLKRYAGEPAIEAGRIYIATDEGAAHPLLLWRDSSTIYYLVGDSDEHIDEAARLLGAG